MGEDPIADGEGRALGVPILPGQLGQAVADLGQRQEARSQVGEHAPSGLERDPSQGHRDVHRAVDRGLVEALEHAAPVAVGVVDPGGEGPVVAGAVGDAGLGVGDVGETEGDPETL